MLLFFFRVYHHLQRWTQSRIKMWTEVNLNQPTNQMEKEKKKRGTKLQISTLLNKQCSHRFPFNPVLCMLQYRCSAMKWVHTAHSHTHTRAQTNTEVYNRLTLTYLQERQKKWIWSQSTSSVFLLLSCLLWPNVTVEKLFHFVWQQKSNESTFFYNI